MEERNIETPDLMHLNDRHPPVSITYPRLFLETDLRELAKGGKPFVEREVHAVYGSDELASVVVSGKRVAMDGVLRLEFAEQARHMAEWVGSDARLTARLVVTRQGILRGSAAGWVRRGASLHPVKEVFISGPRPRRVTLRAAAEEGGEGAELETLWSRQAGAMGAENHGALRELRVGVIGVGGLGSWILRQVVAAGVRELVLVDPDVVERHNTGRGGFYAEAHVGQPKAHVWEDWLAMEHPDRLVSAHVQSITERRALEAALGCHVLFSCADSGAARVAAAGVAAAGCLILIDAGSFIPKRPRPSDPAMGCDVRLVMPGRCLLDMGSVREEGAAMAELAAPEKERNIRRQRVWREERAGSLDSLNLMAAGCAMRNLEDVVAGKLTISQWTRMEFSATGAATLRRLDVPARPERCFCGLGGLGASAIPRMLPILRQRNEANPEVATREDAW